jgi:hypothetical protein
MSNVNQYLNVMKQSGVKAAAVNPKSEFNQIQRELIEHYKVNKSKAEVLIKNVEASGTPITSSPTHKMHYEAAVIAIRGYGPLNNTVPPNKVDAPTDVFGRHVPNGNRENELENLTRAGWKPLR